MITDFINLFFKPRANAIRKYDTDAATLQEQVLYKLIQKAKDTEWGRKYDFRTISDYNIFRNRMPVNTYEELKAPIERMRNGEQNILWPTNVVWFAKSSGTTNDKSKFLPISKEALHDTHYRGGGDCVSLYLNRINPQSHFFSGKGLILGGSHSPNLNSNKSLVGDLSAILMENLNPLVNYIRVPSKQIALMSEWESKINTIAETTIHENVTNLSGVPSWLLALIKKILENTGKSSLEQVWPNLEVFFHGGVSFTPYRDQYLQVIRSDEMHYVETYNASEGFFGIQDDLNDPSMLLMIDYGIFYEFMPIEEVGNENPKTCCLTDVMLGKNYAMIITTSSGLWRYMIGDTVKFTSKNPYKFIITGRIKNFINAFGEELIVDNAEKGIEKACEATGAQVLDYSAAPVFMDSTAKCRHQWLIEFAKQPDSLAKFAEVLDNTLKEVNSDYEAKRSKNITLQSPEVIIARKGLFNDWLEQNGKLGGQHKIPRLCNTRENIEGMLNLNK
jgi:hypothetical protein